MCPCAVYIELTGVRHYALTELPSSVSLRTHRVDSCVGQGGNNYLHDKKQVSAQQLQGPNAALANNIDLKLPVRVIVKVPDRSSWSKNSFIFDGLWDVTKYWSESGKSGFAVFKYRLVRRTDQSLSIKMESKAEIAEKRMVQREAQRQQKVEAKEAERQQRIQEKEARKQQRQDELQSNQREAKKQKQDILDEQCKQEKLEIDNACASVLRGIDFASLIQKSKLCNHDSDSETESD